MRKNVCQTNNIKNKLTICVSYGRFSKSINVDEQGECDKLSYYPKVMVPWSLRRVWRRTTGSNVPNTQKGNRDASKQPNGRGKTER
jgi:hypothetical protein